jgi:hypothetical protein
MYIILFNYYNFPIGFMHFYNWVQISFIMYVKHNLIFVGSHFLWWKNILGRSFNILWKFIFKIKTQHYKEHANSFVMND